MKDFTYQQNEKIKRTWKERLFSLPWQPWKSTKDMLYIYGVDIGLPYDESVRCKAHREDGILIIDEIKPFTFKEYEDFCDYYSKRSKQ
jgi:hypothetical protein